MQRFVSLFLMATLVVIIGCTSDDNPVQSTYRGNPIQGNVSGVLSLDGSPYLVTDTLRVQAGEVLTIDPGVEIRFDLLTEDGRVRALPFIVNGTLIADGLPEAPIVFTSGLQYPSRGDWDGIWLVDADDACSFKYCKFLFGAKYGRRYHYRMINEQLDSLLFEYGSLTLFNSSPTIENSWFVAGGFHGLHCDSLANPVLRNSVFYDNAGHGVFVHRDANPTLQYNIISENDDYGVFCREFGDNPEPRQDLTLDYNIVWSNFSGEFNALAPRGLGRITQTNLNLDSCDYRYNLRLDPAFVDAALWDFRLTPLSAAIDAGPPIDIEPNPDPNDPTRIELGIWSYKFTPQEIRRLITVDKLEASISPYFMTSDVLLAAGETLTIEPGVEVLVQGQFTFRIKGTIKSMGEADNQVVFRSGLEDPMPGYWFGLIFDSNGNNETELHYTNIAHARWGVSLSQRDALLDHCRITSSSLVGVLCDNFSSPTISDCYFENNAIASIQCQYNSSPVILRNTIVRGAGYGIWGLESSQPEIYNNIIIQPSVNGIRLENLSNAIVENNVIYNCGYYGMFCENNSSPEVRNNIIVNSRAGIGIIANRTSRPGIMYNDIWDHSLSAVSISGDTTAIDTDMNYFEDPGFMKLEFDDSQKLIDWDFHLSGGSAMKNAGDPELLNPDGSRSDLGAFGGPRAE